MVIVNILVFLLSLSVVIIIHELGHFVMARRAGILCHEFSLGMGPVLWSKRVGETLYVVKMIPIGGYVMMSGEEIEDEIVKVDAQVRLVFDGNVVSKIVLDHNDDRYDDCEKVTVEKVDLKGIDGAPLYINDYEVKRDAFYVLKKRELQVAPYDRGFNGKTVWQRFLAIFCGPAMNFVLALVVFLTVNLIVGFPDTDSSVLGSIGDNYPADNILEAGDEIISIEGESIDSWDDISYVLSQNPGDRFIDVVVIRNGMEQEFTLTPTLYFFSLGFHSDEQSTNELLIGEVTDNSIAYTAGMRTGDQLVSIYGIDVTTWDDVIGAVQTVGALSYEEGRVVDVVVNRDGELITCGILEPYSTAFLATQGVDIVETKVGISPEYYFSFGKSITGSFKDIGTSSMMIFTTIGLLFDNDGAGAGIGIDNVAGPLGIYKITSAALSNGFISLLSWIGLLSVNLGIINLLPIPALDGGRLVFLGYEAVTRRKLNRKLENSLNYIMFIALMGLFVVITFNDILNLFNIN